MKWLISLLALIAVSNISYATSTVETQEDRSLVCLDYDDENIYLKGKLKYNNDVSKYEVVAETIGFNSRETARYDGEAVATLTNPASGILSFETGGVLAASYKLQKGSRANTFSGTAQLNSNGATYTVNCTYSGPEFPTQGE